MPKTNAQYYLDAAEIVAVKGGYSCDAIAEASGYLNIHDDWVAEEKSLTRFRWLRKTYVDLFSPEGMEEPHLAADMRHEDEEDWWGCWASTEFPAHTPKLKWDQGCRVLALCFMAAIAKQERKANNGQAET